eukprot:TRINITY_DN9116_c0_g1_i1.p2 TRINITY_DN9116_c0_g1~~TRINITY_DN9116_c0_g1_i1.p2  ORF type:complete len:415 (+),score=87.82 TRINITY_DN9116_c0_g1_i1:189-1433(+)
MTGDPSIASYAIWLIRIVLPILLFFFWYRTQAKGEDSETQYDRSELLGARQAGAGQGGPPEALKTLKLYDEAQLQKAGFGTSARGGGARRDGAERGKGGGKRGKGEGKGGEGRGGDKGEGSARDGGAFRHDDSMGSQASNVPSVPPPAPVDENALNREENMHFESLLNFVAFSHKKRPPRVFLVDKENPPPPPPGPRPGTEAFNNGSGAGGTGGDIQDAAKANAEAQMVLKGLVNPKVGLKASNLAKDLYAQLQDANVAPSEATFTLIVEACANDNDLKAASDFLMTMEAGGFCPGSDLLDKVMDLYDFESKSSRKAGDKEKKYMWADDDPAEDLGMPAWAQQPAPPAPAAKSSLTAPSTSMSLRPGGARGGISSSPLKTASTPPWAKRASPPPMPGGASGTEPPDDWSALLED